MLRAIHLNNFRSFDDSGKIELADLNVFIGPNSAGKTNLMTVIELGLQSMSRFEHFSPRPLSLAQIPSFGSFDSVLRRHGPAKDRRSAEFSLTLTWAKSLDSDIFWSRFIFRKKPASGAAFVSTAQYGNGSDDQAPRFIVAATDKSGVDDYHIVAPSHLLAHADVSVSFVGGVPFLNWNKGGRRPGEFLREYAQAASASSYQETLIVRPHRPVPRSIYVLDDPTMAADDRTLIANLLRLWSEEDDEVAQARERIISNLQTMMLANRIEVRALGRKQGPQMAEVRVMVNQKRQAVPLADVGYGVSQVLPLLAHDAQLSEGNLLVYQPEAHLHPLAQSRLADVFVASVKRGNRVYVETHSEHLVLRLQSLIAGREIEPDRVRVFCVEHDGRRSTVTTMAFDERGIPKERWPKGFLDTGLNLARELAEKRQIPTRVG